MPKVLISDKMSSDAEAALRARGVEVDYKPGLSPDELKAILPEYDGIAIRSTTRLTADLIEAATRLKVIGRAGIGVDNVDIPAASKRGVIVMNAPFGNATTTAELTVALALSAARHIPAATASTRAGKWEKNGFMGRELAGKVLGIIGTGNIGTLVVERFLGLKMRVVAYDPFISKQRAEDMGVSLCPTLEEFWPQLDVLTVHTPLIPATRHIVNEEAFSKMKNGVIIVNCARGGIIDEAALYAALKSGKVFAAGLDVFEKEPAKENPLFELDNVVFTPHLGASTYEAQVKVAVQIAEQIADYLLKGTVQNALNIPAVSEGELSTLRPYLNLADKLGTTLGQLTTSGIKRIEILYEGEASTLNRKPITNMVLNSLLSPMLDGVNLVNAPLIAEERGIDVVEAVRRHSQKGFISLLAVTITTETRERCITGTLLYGKDPRIVAMNNIPIEANPEGNLLFVANNDAPGLIGRVGTILGDAGINIANFHLGRKQIGGRAIAFINVDQDVPVAVMDQLRTVQNVLEVNLVRY
ncbi:MAG: phosphoglycerate dehydrogenase [Magnetococcales bacterium]|nr:phosphoglycerate dehydrogenase [Magnetococcales bacterium]MBF0438059.1 phosphoglycerate dehydrogenase [Magnetococcales bacterium]